MDLTRVTNNVLIASKTGIGVWVYALDWTGFAVSGGGCAVAAVAFAAVGHLAPGSKPRPDRPAASVGTGPPT